MRNFTKGYKVYNQLQNYQETQDKKYLGKTTNAIMEYREKTQNRELTPFNFCNVLKMINKGNHDEAYQYLNNWLAENDKDYDGENWCGKTRQ